MNKGEIIQENLRLKSLIDHCNKQLMQALYTIDELTKENAELKDWKDKWEERCHGGN
jgi:FtsZ-binding cell division protein ZapB